MKVATTSFSLLPSILSNKKARLIVITGKGGVGKTTLSIAASRFLQSQGRKVLYCSFDQPANKNLLEKASVNFIDLKVRESAQEYIGKKVGSTTVANWVMKTPFFSSLFNMLPGLGQMILLGNIINMLENDDQLTIVLDSPSSGHALTMLESPQNFKEMFRAGLIVEDILRMQKFLFKESNLELITTSLPSQMATTEALELGRDLEKRGVPSINKVLNDSLTFCNEITESTAEAFPQFIKSKLALESELFDQLDQASDWSMIPHFSYNNQTEVISALTDFFKLNHESKP